MESGRDSPDLGKHLLGPHVVGLRVVVRRVVRGELGPSGGPALTDVLGVCTSWGPTSCVVESDAGPVTIEIADIVSGKPVPPRPSPRQRVSTRDAESRTLALWPELESSVLGDWVLRSAPPLAGRLVKRANSCLAVGSPGVSFAEAEAAVRAFYAERDRQALVQVEADGEHERSFGEAGWTPLGHGDAYFLLASLSGARRALRSRVGSRAPDDTAPGSPTVELWVEDDAQALATLEETALGRATLDGDWLALHALAVVPSHRRRGHALAVLDCLLEWGAERGATTAWLHVKTDNDPALALYESLGFTVHHTMRYLAQPAG